MSSLLHQSALWPGAVYFVSLPCASASLTLFRGLECPFPRVLLYFPLPPRQFQALAPRHQHTSGVCLAAAQLLSFHQRAVSSSSIPHPSLTVPLVFPTHRCHTCLGKKEWLHSGPRLPSQALALARHSSHLGVMSPTCCRMEVGAPQWLQVAQLPRAAVSIVALESCFWAVQQAGILSSACQPLAD